MNKLLVSFRVWLLSALKPLLVWLGHQHLPFTRKRIHHADIEKALAVLEPGDIFLCLTDGELTDVMIPGRFNHAAMFFDQNRVVEAIGTGVQASDLIDFFMEKDELVILRASFFTKEERQKAADWAFTKIGSPYDYQLDPDNAAFYCSELVYQSYKTLYPDRFTIKMKDVLGKGVIAPDDYLKAHDVFKIVWSKATL